VEALKDRLGAANMPEQLFGDSYLRLTHSSGATLDFSAADALAAWHTDNLPPVQVFLAHHRGSVRQLQWSMCRGVWMQGCLWSQHCALTIAHRIRLWFRCASRASGRVNARARWGTSRH